MIFAHFIRTLQDIFASQIRKSYLTDICNFALNILKYKGNKMITYINRKKETYYLLIGKTKTGKPKYYFSKKEK